MPYTPGIFNSNNVVRVTYNMELDSQQMMMVLHARPTTIVINDYFSALDDFNAELQSQLTTGGFWNDVRTRQSDELVYKTIESQRIFNTRDVAVQIAADTTGADVDAAAPPNVAMSVTKHTLIAARNGVGRIQIPGFPFNQMDEGLWNETLVGDINDALQLQLLNPVVTLGGNEWQWVLPQLGQTYGPWQPFTGVTAHNQIRTMHRRTVGLGI